MGWFEASETARVKVCGHEYVIDPGRYDMPDGASYIDLLRKLHVLGAIHGPPGLLERLEGVESCWSSSTAGVVFPESPSFFTIPIQLKQGAAREAAEYARGVADERKAIIQLLASIITRTPDSEWEGVKPKEFALMLHCMLGGEKIPGVEYRQEAMVETALANTAPRRPSARWQTDKWMGSRLVTGQFTATASAAFWVIYASGPDDESESMHNVKQCARLVNGRADSLESAQLACEQALRALLRAAMEDLG